MEYIIVVDHANPEISCYHSFKVLHRLKAPILFHAITTDILIKLHTIRDTGNGIDADIYVDIDIDVEIDVDADVFHTM